MKTKRAFGYIIIFLSVIFFILMTVFVKKTSDLGNIKGIEITFFRFIYGFLFINMTLIITKRKIKPVNYKPLFARAVLNTLSVLFFFITISLSTVTKGNIYNMTYPLFVAIIAHYFLKERLNKTKIIAVIVTFIGILIILFSKSANEISNFHLELADVTGILCALFSGVSMVSLRWARLTEDSFTILYFLMGLGMLMLIFLLIITRSFVMPNSLEFMYLTLVGISSYLGQLTLTIGYKYVEAAEGSLISATRIFLVIPVGVIFMGETFIPITLLGGLLIFIGIFFMNYDLLKRGRR